MEELDPRASNTDEPEVTTELPTMIDEPMAPLPPPPGGPDVDMSAVATAQKPSVPNRQYNRPEQKSTTTKLPYDELQWREIGSGSWARTLVDAEKLILTTRGGPCEADVERRIVRDAITGKLIDDCQPANTPDKTLFRQLPVPTTIRVELIMKDAAKWFRQKNADVAEMYSPPRIVQEAGLRVYGGRRLRPGWSLDLSVNDPETGTPWDLSDGKIRTKAVNLITEGKPFMLILSPMCTAFSQIQAINKERRDPAVVRRELDEAKDHIRWVMKLCALQARANRYFVFEHPASASSWEMAEIKKVHDMEGVMRIKFDMCRFGMEAVDPVDGIAKPIQKQTAILTNSYEVAQRLNRSCPNRCPDKSCHHQHLRLEGGTRCKQAQVYPREFCRAICEGIAAQRRIDSINLVAMDVMSMEELAAFGHDDLHDNHTADDKYEAYDDVSDDPLIPSLVQAARKEELQYFKEMKVYEYAPLAECLKVTGKQPIGTRWIDTNKGDSSRPNYRSRLVAKEYKIKDQPELYAATPPTECMRLLISKAAEKKSNKMIYIDISRAYFYAKSVRPTYVKLPAEDPRSSDPTCCARLLMSMYGTRDAALNWHEEYAETLKQAGYVRGIANPCLFYNAKSDVSVMVHGDDFLATGDGKAVEGLKRVLSNAYKVKVETLGNDDGDLREIRVLNRVLRLTAAGYRLEADPRHAEAVVRDLGLVGAKSSKLPGSKEEKRKHSEVGDGIATGVDGLAPITVAAVCTEGLAPIATVPAAFGPKPGGSKPGKSPPLIYPSGKGRGADREISAIGPAAVPDVAPTTDPDNDDETPLAGDEARLFRGIAARLNYIGPDRPDMQFAVKEAARLMSSPRKCDWRILRKIGRYLLRRPRVALLFNYQHRPAQLDGFSDSDWAGCSRSRKSTSGGVIMLGSHAIKSWSRQQKTIALSSAEAETHGMVACSCELLGIQSCAKDLGITLGASVYADASAALGIIKRRGIGKLRHIQTQCLWLQEAHATKRLHFEKIDGSRNPSDLLTKHLSEVLMDRHMKVIGALPEDGRAATAPTLASLGINERPLCGHDAPVGTKERPDTLPEGALVDRKKREYAYGGSRRFTSSTGAAFSGGVGIETRPGATGFASLPPRAAATRSSCQQNGCHAMSSCLGDEPKLAKETSSSTARETTVGCTVTSSVHKSCVSRCVDAGVDVLNAGCTPSRKHAPAHGSVCGSTLKPTHGVGRVSAERTPSAQESSAPPLRVVSRYSEKPKAPGAEGRGQPGAYTHLGPASPFANLSSGASTRETNEDQPRGREDRGGDAAAANVRATAPQGVRILPSTERAASVAAPREARPRSALRVRDLPAVKSAWADIEEESEEELALASAETWSSRQGKMKVGFDEKVAVHHVPAYSEIYGAHPRTFNFSHDGTKIPIVGPVVPDTLRRTRYPREHSLALCEMQPATLDSTRRRSMNACSIYQFCPSRAAQAVHVPCPAPMQVEVIAKRSRKQKSVSRPCDAHPAGRRNTSA